jgi:hypothetical protein
MAYDAFDCFTRQLNRLIPPFQRLGVAIERVHAQMCTLAEREYLEQFGKLPGSDRTPPAPQEALPYRHGLVGRALSERPRMRFRMR